MPPKKKAVPPEKVVQTPPAEAVPPVSPVVPVPSPSPPGVLASPQPTPAGKREPMVKSKALSALISLFLPGVCLILGNPSRTLEGAAVFIIVAILDTIVVLVSVVGGPIAGVLTQGICCLLMPILLLGLLLIPILHVIAAIHTWMRC